MLRAYPTLMKGLIMLKLLRNTVLVCATSVALVSTAHADINTSLKTVCSNAKSQNNDQMVEKTQATNSQYNTRLANYYAGISCHGKSLIISSTSSENQLSGFRLNSKAPN
jgi:hypothetical protein